MVLQFHRIRKNKFHLLIFNNFFKKKKAKGKLRVHICSDTYAACNIRANSCQQMFDKKWDYKCVDFMNAAM